MPTKLGLSNDLYLNLEALPLNWNYLYSAVVAITAFLDQHENDTQLLRAIKLQSALLEGFEKGRDDMIEIIKKLTTNPN